MLFAYWLCVGVLVHMYSASETEVDPLDELDDLIQSLKDRIIPLIPTVEEFQINARNLSQNFRGDFADEALQIVKRYDKQAQRGTNQTIQTEVAERRAKIVAFRQIYNGLKVKGRNQKYSSNEMLHNLLYIAGVGEELYILDNNKKIWRYDPAHKNWNYWMNLPEWCSGSNRVTAVAPMRGRGFVVAGAFWGDGIRKASIIDVTLREEVPLPDFPRPISEAGLHYDGHCIYQIGTTNYVPGMGWGDSATGWTHRLCQSDDDDGSWENRWTRLSFHPSSYYGTGNSVLASTEQYVYLFGGYSSWETYFADVTRYNKADDSWQKYEDMADDVFCSVTSSDYYFDGDTIVVMCEMHRLTFNMTSQEATYQDNGFIGVGTSGSHFRITKYRGNTMIMVSVGSSHTYQSYVYDHDIGETRKYHVTADRLIHNMVVV